MPCHDPREGYDEEHNNVAAELLCELLRRTPKDNIEWTERLTEWWADHQDRDAYYRRKEREWIR